MGPIQLPTQRVLGALSPVVKWQENAFIYLYQFICGIFDDVVISSGYIALIGYQGIR
jgi:hypothetical protein